MNTPRESLADASATPPEREHEDQAVSRVSNPFASAPIVAAPTGSGAAALVQREVAEVQSAMVIAKSYPRDARIAVDRILMACTRQALAEKALYEYARGGTKITGPSIRLAEEIARQWGNMLSGVTEISRHGNQSECLAYAWDLETNYRDEKRFTVRHWRDRSADRGGGYVLTDERDIYEVIANQGARRKRACILAVVPGDVTEAAVHQVDVTLSTKVQVTPERIKDMVETFANDYGVTKEQLEKRIQRRIDTITPALFLQLGRIYNSIKDGMSSPKDWFESEQGAGETDKAQSTADSVRGKLSGKGAAK